MLKRFIFIGLIIFGLISLVSAQSGRRIKIAPTPTSNQTSTQTSSNNSSNTGEQEIGYSESSPNRVIPIFAKPRGEKKSKSDKKVKEDKTQTQTVETPQTNEPGVETDDEIIKIEANLVTIPVSVYSKAGIYIPGLEQHNFKVFENGKEQEITYFGTTDTPFTVILLLDVSSSALFKIEDIRQAAMAFVNELKPQDSVMVIAFDDNVNVLTDVTNDRQKINKAINRANFGGGTSLYDAVETSLGKRLDKIEGRKAIVLFTDGVDTTSFRANYESTLRDAAEADALIFPIYYNTFLATRGIGGGGAMSTPPTIGIPGMGGQVPKGLRSEDYTRGRQYLDDLAELTGGKVFRPESTPGGLTSAFEGIAEELRRQYNIGYYPSELGQNGERKQIRVRVNRPNLVIRARDSYIVGANAK
jgi:VWFA-related protein